MSNSGCSWSSEFDRHATHYSLHTFSGLSYPNSNGIIRQSSRRPTLMTTSRCTSMSRTTHTIYWMARASGDTFLDLRKHVCTGGNGHKGLAHQTGLDFAVCCRLSQWPAYRTRQMTLGIADAWLRYNSANVRCLCVTWSPCNSAATLGAWTSRNKDFAPYFHPILIILSHQPLLPLISILWLYGQANDVAVDATNRAWTTSVQFSCVR